jgi:hypothetical protein
VAVTVKEKLPAEADERVDMVSVEVAEVGVLPVKLTVEGEKTADAPAGRPVMVRSPSNLPFPFRVTVTVNVALPAVP